MKKKTTKFLSLLLAVMLTVSCFSILSAVPASAADEEQMVYFQYPDESVWTHEGLKINSRTGVANVYCYAYAIYGNTQPYKLGWKTRTTQCTAVTPESGVITDSTLFSFNLAGLKDQPPIEEGADYGIIFSTAAAGQNQTCDLNLSTDCLGDTVYVTPFNGEADRENAADSKKRDHYAAWMNHSDPYGPKATISSLGALMPGYFPAHQPHAQQLSNALKQYLTNPVNNAYFQYENNMVLCEALNVTPQEVYDQYMADNADNISGEPEVDEKNVPCPFYRYTYLNEQNKETEGKLAAPDYVKSVLGLATEPTEPPYQDVVDEATGVTVTINNPNAVLTVDEVTSGTDFDGANTALADDGKQVAKMYDINLTDGDAEYQPAEAVTVKIPSDVEDGVVYRYADGELTDMNASYADGAYTFTADHFSYYLIAEEAPAPAEDYSIIGSSDVVFGGTWWVDNPDSAMTLDTADGLYKRTYTGVAAQKMLQLKVIKDHDENQCWPTSGGNYTFDVNSEGDITVTFNPETGEINVIGDITVVTGIEITSMIAAGNGEDTYLNGANWDPCDPANAMTEVEPGVWEITMEDIYAFDNYQIKFVANSVDEDGNPVSNPWGINWGTEKEALYPVGEPIDATFNGKNCIFEVEEDESVVTIQLDLRNFDYETKQGAVFTITVTPPAPVHEHTPGEAVQENFHDADCTTPGSYDSVVYCTTCNEELSRETVTIKAKGHTPGTAVQENFHDADCTHAGSYDSVVYCTTCGAEVSRETVTIKAKGHTPGTAVRENVVNAGCTTPGSYDSVVYCTTCNAEISRQTVNTSATGHRIRFVAQVNATETADGVKAHYECLNCHELYSDAEGKNEVTAESLVIPKLTPATEPTTEPEPTVEPTTEPEPTTPVPGDSLTINAVSNVFTADSKTYTDTDGDGIPDTVTIMYYADVNALRLQAIQFALVFDPDVLSFDPEKNGEYDEDIEDYDYTNVFPVALGTGDVTVTRPGRLKFAVANYLGFQLKKNGKLVPIAKVVLDIAEGATGTTDVDMQFGVVAFVDPKTEEEYIVYSDASGMNQEMYDAVTANGGSMFSVVGHRVVIDEGKDATCTESGLTEGSHCEICGEVIKAQEVIPAKGHTAVTDPKVPATCTETGLTAGLHCSVCNAIIKAQTVIPAKGHTTVVDPAVPATCTEPGLTQGSHCSVCNEVIVAQQEVKAKGHTEVIDPEIPPTCTAFGYTAGSHCSVCGEVIEPQWIIPANGHTEVIDPAVPASCTQSGLTQGSHCSVCNEVIVAQQAVPAKGHTPGTEVQENLRAADCTHEGSYDLVVYCTECGEVVSSKTAIIPAKGHTAVIDPAVPATCTETGLTQGSHCSVCNEVIVAQQVVKALGHLERMVPGYAATYTSEGLTDGVFCDRCNEWVVPQVVIPKLKPAHLIGDVNRDGNVDVLDAVLVQKYSASKATLDDEQLYIGDVNDDGTVDILDAVQIQKYAGEKIFEFKKKA